MRENIHIHVKIDWELERIRKGEWTVLSECTDTQAWNILQKAKSEWKIYWSWCDNMKEDWSCWWHPSTLRDLWEDNQWKRWSYINV